MRRMGGACSMPRPSRRESPNDRSGNRPNRSGSESSTSPIGRRLARHSVTTPIPDDAISRLYPRAENYITEDNGLRSPKSLAELCTDTLCRSLAYLNGELPPGLPQDVVDDIVGSLVKHNAFNATTLRLLKNCELGSLTLAGCRGVTDEWLEPLGPQTFLGPQPYDTAGPRKDVVEGMDIDHCHSSEKNEEFYNASSEHHDDNPHNCGVDESSCSTSSFVSAASSPYVASAPCGKSESHENGQFPVASDHTDPLIKDDEMAFGSPVSGNAVTANIKLLDLRGSQRLTDKGLSQLYDLSNVEVARLDNCHSIVGRGLVVFSTSNHLHTLSLANCRRLTDEAIVNISHLTSLVAISLDGCRCLTDRSLAALSGLFQLKKLDLSQCDLLTDTGLRGLENLEEIEELSLGWCRLITDNGIDILSKQPGRSKMLRILGLARCPITDAGVEKLGRLSALEELDLNGCSSIGSSSLGRALGQLTKLTNLNVSYCSGILRASWQGRINSLRSLELCYSGVRDSHLSRLTDLPELEELNLDSCPVGDWAIGHLADNCVLPKLTSLDLADTEITDLGMVHLAKFTKLRRLSLFYCNISNGGLRHLAQLTCLEVLNLDSREIGDEGLWYLRNLKSLKSLDIFSGRITDSGCSHISKLRSLESLELCGGGVGDMGCNLLSTLNNLTSLNLSQNERITNRGASALSALVNLKALNLSNTRVTSNALEFFTGLKKLQSLALYGCKGVEGGTGLTRLQNVLPSLKCVRLNNTPDDDGVFVASGDSDDSSDEEDFDFHSGRGYAGRRGVQDHDDNDSEMDDGEEGSSSSSNSVDYDY